MNPTKPLTVSERISLERILPRLDDKIRELKGQMGEDAFGNCMGTAEQKAQLKALKERRAEVEQKLGIP